MNVRIVRDIVAVVFQRGWIEGEKPDRRYSQILEVIQSLSKSRKIADSVVIAVEERADVQFIDDGIFVPERIVFKCEAFRKFWHAQDLFSSQDVGWQLVWTQFHVVCRSLPCECCARQQIDHPV